MNKRRPTKKLDYKVDENGCFVCTSHIANKDGYCHISINGTKKSTHRHVYYEMYGEIPAGMVVRHKCDNPTCINPEHLETGTHADNMHDMAVRNRAARMIGIKNPNVKLTETDIKHIRQALEIGISGYKLAIAFGVSTTHIYDIRDGKLWSGVKTQ